MLYSENELREAAHRIREETRYFENLDWGNSQGKWGHNVTPWRQHYPNCWQDLFEVSLCVIRPISSPSNRESLSHDPWRERAIFSVQFERKGWLIERPLRPRPPGGLRAMFSSSLYGNEHHKTSSRVPGYSQWVYPRHDNIVPCPFAYFWDVSIKLGTTCRPVQSICRRTRSKRRERKICLRCRQVVCIAVEGTLRISRSSRCCHDPLCYVQPTSSRVMLHFSKIYRKLMR